MASQVRYAPVYDELNEVVETEINISTSSVQTQNNAIVALTSIYVLHLSDASGEGHAAGYLSMIFIFLSVR